jgi:hypothetical protein
VESSLARSPESSEVFFREVDEEVRREKVATAARRYGVIVVVLVVIGLAAFGGSLLWRNHQKAEAGERGEALTAAMSSVSAGNKDAARKKLEPLVKDGKAYGALAQLTLADMQVQAGQDQLAADAFMKVANDGAAPSPIRDLALIRATAIGFDKLAPAEVVKRMKPLAAPGNAWFGSAAELTAIAQMKMGQTKQAGALLAAITRDAHAPDTVKERARQLAGELGVDTENVVKPTLVR